MDKTEVNKIMDDYKEYLEIQFNIPRELMGYQRLYIRSYEVINMGDNFIYSIRINPQYDFENTLSILFYNDYIQVIVYCVDEKTLNNIDNKFIFRRSYNTCTCDMESIEFSYSQDKDIKDLLLNFI